MAKTLNQRLNEIEGKFQTLLDKLDKVLEGGGGVAATEDSPEREMRYERILPRHDAKLMKKVRETMLDEYAYTVSEEEEWLDEDDDEESLAERPTRLRTS